MPYQPHYKHIPPAGLHVLTTLYDFFCDVFGLGKKFRRRILADARIQETGIALDVGCGTGVFLSLLQDAHPSIRAIGIDPDKTALKIAQKRLRKYSDIKLIEAFAESLPIENNAVDVCFSTLALHHMPDGVKRGAIREMYRVLKQKGRVVIADFGKTDNYWIRKLLFFEKAEYLDGNFKGLILNYLKEAGFQNIRRTSIKFPAIHTILAEK